MASPPLCGSHLRFLFGCCFRVAFALVCVLKSRAQAQAQARNSESNSNPNPSSESSESSQLETLGSWAEILTGARPVIIHCSLCGTQRSLSAGFDARSLLQSLESHESESEFEFESESKLEPCELPQTPTKGSARTRTRSSEAPKPQANEQR